MDEFNEYSVEIDADCVNQDFDNYDLYGEIMEESDNTFGDDIEFN